MDGLLAGEGHTQAASPDDADVIIVNTCSFIAAARDETLAVLRSLGETKRDGQQLIAAGCMAQSHGADVAAVPGVDTTLSTRQWMQIGSVVGQRTAANGKALPVIGLAQASSGSSSLAVELASPQPAAPAPELHPSSFSPQPLIGLAQASSSSGSLAVAMASPTPPVEPGLHPSSFSPQPSEAGYADWRTAQIRRTRSAPSAYLKISDGCNLRCAFCTIPSFKGNMASKPLGAVLAEARELAEAGVREIVLVAQHLTDYGRDLGLKDGLATLLDELCQVLPEDRWVRLMYAYPHGISERLIEVMAARPQICKYLDMPLQHAHPATLRRMRRPPDTERTRGIIGALRAAMPDLALRSTFIVGFPGETTAEFRALLDFLAEMQLDRVGAFRYSQEPGTHAATLPDQVRPQVIEKRWHELMQLQRQVSIARTGRWLGRSIPVLIEGHGKAADGRPLAVGRSFRDAPEVDGQVFVWGAPPVGTIVPVQVTQTTEYDLWGQAV